MAYSHRAITLAALGQQRDAVEDLNQALACSHTIAASQQAKLYY
jgi:5-enolpyruvylshikimate-3-phosphate synthase